MGIFKDSNGKEILNDNLIIRYRGITDNVIYKANDIGYYSYKGYTDGAPTDWGGIVVTLRKKNTDIDPSTNDNSYFKLAFDRTGIFVMVLNSDGTVLISWKQIIKI